jgi:hypothetical protein
MSHGGARPGAGRPRKSTSYHKRARNYRADRHGEPEPVEATPARDPRGGANRKTLLEHVRARTFRWARHAHLLDSDDSLAPYLIDDLDEDTDSRLFDLATLALWWRAEADKTTRDQIRHAFSALAQRDRREPALDLIGEDGDLGWYLVGDELLLSEGAGWRCADGELRPPDDASPLARLPLIRTPEVERALAAREATIAAMRALREAERAGEGS